MSGAGSATVAYALEDGYLGAPKDVDGDGNVDYWQPGRNITVGEIPLQRALSRSRDPDSPTPAGSIAQNVEGAISVSFDLAGDHWHELVFNNGTATGWVDGAMPSSRWYFGANALPGVTERVAKGAVVTGAQMQYQQGQTNRVELQLIYGDEEKNSGITPSGITAPSTNDVYAGHGADLSIDTVAQTKLQNATLDLSPNARFHRGPSQHPLDAVIGAVNPSLSMAATFETDDNLSAAYGSSTATSVEAVVNGVGGTLEFTNALGATITYDLSYIQPDQYDWTDLVNAENDLNEQIEYHVADVAVV